MNWLLLTVSANKESWLKEVEAEYCKKLNGFCKFSTLSLKPKSLSRESRVEKKAIESAQIESQIEPTDFVILFDERGSELDSREFSHLVTQASESGKRRVLFIIGGAFGVSESIQKKAHKKVALSKMILNHHVAKLVALEQIYRGWTLIKNIPYHND